MPRASLRTANRRPLRHGTASYSQPLHKHCASTMVKGGEIAARTPGSHDLRPWPSDNGSRREFGIRNGTVRGSQCLVPAGSVDAPVLVAGSVVRNRHPVGLRPQIPPARNPVQAKSCVVEMYYVSIVAVAIHAAAMWAHFGVMAAAGITRHLRLPHGEDGEHAWLIRTGCTPGNRRGGRPGRCPGQGGGGGRGRWRELRRSTGHADIRD